MVRLLSRYSGEYQIFTVSRSRETTAYLLENGLEVGQFHDDRLVLLPENRVTYFTDSEAERMQVFEEFDVLEIGADGILYRLYSDTEGDAGIVTTARCNSNCVMCPAGNSERQKGNDTSLEQLDRILRHMPKDLWHFTITGGEPTLIGEESFVHVLESVRRELPDTKILLLTNGRTLGDKGFFERFQEAAPRNFRVAVPIHGSTALKHDRITQAPGSFAQTLRGIANLLKAKIEVELRIVVSKLNADDLMDIAGLICRLFPAVAVVNFIGLEMRGNCVVHADRVLISYQEAFEKSKAAINYLARHGINVGLYNFPYCMIEKAYWPIARKSISAYKSKFYDECGECAMREECCGIFAATMRFYHPPVWPVGLERQYD